MKTYKEILEKQEIIPMPSYTLSVGDRVSVYKNLGKYQLPSAKLEDLKKVLAQSGDGTVEIMDITKTHIVATNDSGLTRVEIPVHNIETHDKEKTLG